MKIDTNIDELDMSFVCERSHWFDDITERNATVERCIMSNGYNWHSGVGELRGFPPLEYLLGKANTDGGLVMSGVLCLNGQSGKLFKNICIVVVPRDGVVDRKEWLGGYMEVEDGEIIEYDHSPVYDETVALGILEEFGYDFCDYHRSDMDDLWQEYNDEFNFGEDGTPSFRDWFAELQLISEDQLFEAEFEGPQWTYYNLLADYDMQDAFFSGGERWRSERLKSFDFDTFVQQKRTLKGCD